MNIVNFIFELIGYLSNISTFFILIILLLLSNNFFLETSIAFDIASSHVYISSFTTTSYCFSFERLIGNMLFSIIFFVSILNFLYFDYDKIGIFLFKKLMTKTSLLFPVVFSSL